VRARDRRRVARVPARDVEVRAQGRERIAQLVRQRRQELVLAPVRLAQLADEPRVLGRPLQDPVLQLGVEQPQLLLRDGEFLERQAHLF